MGIRFQCYHCGCQMHVKNFQAGKKGRCPECNGRFLIPEADAQYSLPIESRKQPQLVTTSPTLQVEPHQISDSHAVDVTPTLELNALAQSVLDEQQNGVYEKQNASVGARYRLEQPKVISEAPLARWYVQLVGGERFGPVQGDLLWQWLQEDRIGVDAMMWREDWPEWLPANQVLQDYFRQCKEEVAFESIAPPPTASPSRTSENGLNQQNQSGASSPAAMAASAASAASATSKANSIVRDRELKKLKRRRWNVLFIAVLVIMLTALVIGLAWALMRTPKVQLAPYSYLSQGCHCMASSSFSR